MPLGDEKKVTFTGDGSDLFATMDKIRSKSQELANSFIDVNKAVGDTNDEFTKLGRTRISAQQLGGDILRRSQSFTSPTLQSQYIQSSVEKIKSQNKEEDDPFGKLQVSLLEELIDTIKDTAREEIAEDRKHVEQNLAQFRKGKGVGDMTPEEIYKLTLQEGLIGEDVEETTRNRNLGGVRRAASLAGGLAGSRNEFYAIAGMIALIPVLGDALSQITSEILSEGDALSTARRDYFARTGRDLGDLGKGGIGGKGRTIGLSRQEEFQLATQLAAARGYSFGGFDNSGRDFETDVDLNTRALKAQSRLYGISDSELLNVAQFQRFDVNNKDTFGDIENTMNILKKSGFFGPGGEDRSSLVKLLQIQNQLIQDQTQVFEFGNQDNVAKLMGAFRTLGGSFANPLTIGNRISGLNQALAAPQGDFEQAFNYSILRELDPDASFFKLQEMQERGIYQKDFLQATFKRINRGPGGKDYKMLEFMKRTRLSASQTRGFFDNFDEEEFNAAIEQNIAKGMTKQGAIDKAALDATTAFEQAGAARKTGLGQAGEVLINAANEPLQELLKKMDLFIEAGGGNQKITLKDLEDFKRTLAENQGLKIGKEIGTTEAPLFVKDPAVAVALEDLPDSVARVLSGQKSNVVEGQDN